jgi:hypothetical protein
VTDSPEGDSEAQVSRPLVIEPWSTDVSLDTLVFPTFWKPGLLQARMRFELGLRRLEWYVEAAQEQVVRLNAQTAKYIEDLKAEPPRIVPWTSAQLLADAHFYFICWDSVAKALDVLRSNPVRLEAPQLVYRIYRTRLEHYQAARDHLEHYDERLPLGGENSTWKHKSGEGWEQLSGDPGAVRLGNKFTINCEEWDVSIESAKTLTALWQSLEQGLREELRPAFEAWANGQSPNA